ncbi:MAG: pre-rRNA processing [Lasallia pustulata]|uniref:Pre-rRNA processing n=1 Tax=Lasallia pustulata TaxID=136370 RepID=A0A5M8PL85_9LECA|nr:MAG: pre-rRNA processing [Lasallia pustulata]
MADNPPSPLSGPEQSESSRPERPASQRSKASKRSRQSHLSIRSGESTPLLSRDVDRRHYGDEPADDVQTSPAATSLRSLQNGSESKDTTKRKWPTIVSLALLSLVLLAILGLGFAAPAVVEEYAKQAMVFKPTDLSIDSFTPTGVRARIKGNFTLDGSRVHKKPVRDLGRAGTWIARAVESRTSKVKVYLPEYDDLLLGTAEVPPITVDIRDGHITHVDFKTDLEPGDLDGIRRIANDWLDGRLGQLRVQGKAEVSLKSGLFSLGTQSISQTLLFEGEDLPDFPRYNITRFKLHEVNIPDFGKGMAADVSLALHNDYPVQFAVPPLGFDILVPNCTPEDPYIRLAVATTDEIHIEPKKDVIVDVGGVIGDLSKTLTTVCPDTHNSPLDSLLGTYIHGDDTTLFVRGSENTSPGTPGWITDLIKSVIVPIPFPGHTFDNLIRNFTLANVHFSLPNPVADPGTPEAQPKLSAVVKAVVGLPKEINFPIDVSRVRADADVYYHDKKLGFLDLRKWQAANSTRTEAHGSEKAGLAVESIVKGAPLEITDDDVFIDVVQALIFGGKGVVLGIKAKVDVETETALGTFIVRDIPAKGKVFVKR